MSSDLQRRIESLERSSRRWRLLAVRGMRENEKHNSDGHA